MGLWSTLVERFAGSEINRLVDVKMREALPAGLIDADEQLWRRVSRQRYEEDSFVQEVSLQQVYKLYTCNPLAKWCLEMTRDLITAEGVEVTSKNDTVKDVLNDFWQHDLNLMDINLPQMVLELGLWGEQCWPAFLPDSGTGIVSLGLVSSDLIKEVRHDPGNCALPIGVCLKDEMGQPGAKLKIIYNKPDEELFTQRVRDLRANEFVDGQCFWFKINTVRHSSRGLSDLFTLSDWLDGYEELLFNLRDRDADLRAFAWDVTLSGMDQQQINAWLAATDKPKPGSWFAHNENVVLEPKTPELNAIDTTIHSRLYRNHILGSMGFSEHWYGGGGDVNRACYSEDTETLTIDGWRNYQDITPNTLIAQYEPNLDKLEYVPAGPVFLYDYDGDMIHFKNQMTDILVTPDHRMYARKWNSTKNRHLERWDIYTAEAIASWQGQERRWWLIGNAPWDTSDLERVTVPEVRDPDSRAVFPALDLPADAFIEFMGYWLSEGHTRRDRGYEVGLTQKNAVGIDMIRKCLDKMPALRWRQTIEPHGTVRWRCIDQGLWTYLRYQGGAGSHFKHFPQLLKHLSLRQSAILFDALILGDGTRHNERVSASPNQRHVTYFSVSKALIDDVQILAMRLGYRTSIWQDTREGKGGLYHLHLSPNRRESQVRTRQIKRIPYSGKVYCYRVPSGLFVTRRNGRVAIQGNTAEAMHTPTFKRYLQRQRYVKYMLDHVLKFQLRVAAEGGLISGDDIDNYKIDMPQMVTEDLTKIAASLTQLTAACAQAVDLGWIEADSAQSLFATVASRLGVEVPQDGVKAREQAHVTPDYRDTDPEAEERAQSEALDGYTRAWGDWR